MCMHLQCMLIVHSSTGTYSVNMQSEWCRVYGCNGLNNVQCLLVLLVHATLIDWVYLGDHAQAS